jgi:hypothetical protein
VAVNQTINRHFCLLTVEPHCMFLDWLRNTGIVSKDATVKQACIDIIAGVQFLILVGPAFVLSPYPAPWGIGLGYNHSLRPLFEQLMPIVISCLAVLIAKFIIMAVRCKRKGTVSKKNFLLDEKIIVFWLVLIGFEVYTVLKFIQKN